MLSIDVKSEIGHLEGVILHTPGAEIEKMTPSTIKESLYSDLLNLNIAQKEYKCFEGVLSKWTKTYQVLSLLTEVLKDEGKKINLLNQILKQEGKTFLFAELIIYPPDILAKFLIEGYLFQNDLHPKEYKKRKYILTPLYNFFFTRDASSSIYNQVLINSMQYEVRDRESLIMEVIFKEFFNTETINPKILSNTANTEGGDILVAREDVLLIGQGSRTNKDGIDFLVKYFAARKQKQSILIQTLPDKPESFIHLDMVFTMLDKDICMVYEPLISKKNTQYNSYLIDIDNGHISVKEMDSFMEGLKYLDFDLNPLKCGGDDPLFQDREQWHSGANFFALGEGQIIGYERNRYTIETLNNNGFEVINSKDVCSDKVVLDKNKKFVVTLEAAELPRGGGGARCMTMPIRRKPVDW